MDNNEKNKDNKIKKGKKKSAEDATVIKMTEQEIKDWDDLYQYVRGDIMGYDKTKMLPKYFTLRLKGLTEGKFMSNKSQKSYGKYNYKVILYTFKICRGQINKALANVVINSEQHKVNLIMSIIEREINDVCDRLEKAEKCKTKMEEIKLPQQDSTRAEYKKKDKKENSHLSDLW